ncbi:hypothetical protein EDD78_101386 [Harryflintia acetispora]|uniref:Uncharacterized protein n=1 Tax=Harryflintia acetispora TaxID=1849041 RepID=A0A9X8ULX5_9FIRM|nr:hypothetical protein EDD78_101386 [Harryflintia acetispora]
MSSYLLSSLEFLARGGEANLPVEGLTGHPQEGVPHYRLYMVHIVRIKIIIKDKGIL